MDTQEELSEVDQTAENAADSGSELALFSPWVGLLAWERTLGQHITRAVWQRWSAACRAVSREDLEQEAALALLSIRAQTETLPDARAQALAATVLYRALRKCVAREFRQRGKTSSLEDLGIDPERASAMADERLADWEALIADELGQTIGRQEIAGAIRRLKTEHQDVLNLYYFHGLTDAEIAQRLSDTVGAIQQRHGRAIERLRQLLGHGSKRHHR